MVFINNKNKIVNDLAEWQITKQELNAGDWCKEVNLQGETTEIWTYNGNLWLGRDQKSDFNFLDINASKNIILTINKQYDLYIKTLLLNYIINGKNEPGKYWNFNLYIVDKNLNKILINSLNSLNSLNQTFDSLTVNINLQDKIVLNNTLFYLLEAKKIGNSGILSISGNLNYQYFRNPL